MRCHFASDSAVTTFTLEVLVRRRSHSASAGGYRVVAHAAELGRANRHSRCLHLRRWDLARICAVLLSYIGL